MDKDQIEGSFQAQFPQEEDPPKIATNNLKFQAIGLLNKTLILVR